MGQLNDLQIRAAAPRGSEYFLSDGEGLYLRVRPAGKTWFYRYKRAGTEARLSLGPYPEITLATARKKARAEAEKRAHGVDPREARRVPGRRSPATASGRLLERWFVNCWDGTAKSSSDILHTCLTKNWAEVTTALLILSSAGE